MRSDAQIFMLDSHAAENVSPIFREIILLSEILLPFNFICTTKCVLYNVDNTSGCEQCKQIKHLLISYAFGEKRDEEERNIELHLRYHTEKREDCASDFEMCCRYLEIRH